MKLNEMIQVFPEETNIIILEEKTHKQLGLYMKKSDIPLIIAEKKVLSVTLNWDAKLLQITVDMMS